mmetsp:Transcript_30841/g.49670  ORF Transcript_30841/g.49670 Transcript_30841/m.49670 type:complete len:826 (+) Transcript_30841:94-2571(+)
MEEELDVDSLHLEPFAPRTSVEGSEGPSEKGTESTPVPSKKSTSKTSAVGKAITVAGQLPHVRRKDGNAVKLDNVRTGRRMSGSSGDPFEGDNLDDILKSLISTKKMDSAYQRIGKRLMALESYVEELRGGEGDEAFITRGEFIEFLQKSQEDVEAQIQAEHDARLAAEEARRLQEELEAQKEDPLIIEVRETLKAQEETNECNLKQAMDEARKADVQKWSRVGQLQEQIDDVKRALGDESKKRQSSEALFERNVKQINKSIQDLERRMQNFAVNEAQKMIGALLFTNGATDETSSTSLSKSPLRVDTLQSKTGSEIAMVPVPSIAADEARPSSRPSEAQEFSELLMDRRQKAFARAREGISGACGGPEEWRVAMLNLVDSGLIQPVRDQVERLHRDLLRQRDTFEKKNRAREKEIQETTKHGQKTFEILKEVYKVILESNEKIADDVQVAMDRIRTVQMMIDGHSKQIDGHTKAILDCATSEEAAKLEELFSTQMSEVKTMVIKQSERIGSIDLQVSVMAKNVTSPTSSSRRGNLKKLGRVRSKTLNRDASKGSMVASTAPGQDSVPSFFADGDDEGEDDASDPGQPSLSKSRSVASKLSLPVGRNFAEDDDEWYEESEYSEDPMEEQMREQVQGICMGLVCLAHHVLRGPPQVGLSRQNRLLNEKELLEELMSLRFWVTHRKTPPDWSLDRLTTVALRYSHPNPNEVHGPQPEMTSILQASSKDEKSEKGRTIYPLDTSVGTIGISGSLGSSAGGGAGILGGPLEDATLLPSPVAQLPVLEGSRVVPSQASSSGSGWRSQPLSAREVRRGSHHLATTALPPVG